MLRFLFVAILIFTGALATEIEKVETVNTENVEIAEKAENEETPKSLEKKSSNYCYHEGHILMNGQSAQSRNACYANKCTYGRIRREQIQCSINNRCIPVGKTVTEKCVTYRCDRRRDRRGGVRFSVSTISAKCVDAHGNCRRPGERFPHVQNGRYHSRCTCRQTRQGNKVLSKYQC